MDYDSDYEFVPELLAADGLSYIHRVLNRHPGRVASFKQMLLKYTLFKLVLTLVLSGMAYCLVVLAGYAFVSIPFILVCFLATLAIGIYVAFYSLPDFLRGVFYWIYIRFEWR